MDTHTSGADGLPSLLRKSRISSSIYEHDRRFDARNSEDVHRDVLAAALAEHERIRDIAIRAYQLHEAREAQEKLRQHTLQEEERVRIATERAQDECRLRDIENKARSIPRPAPRVKTPPPIGTPNPIPPPVQAAQQVPPPPAAKAQKPTPQPTPQALVSNASKTTQPPTKPAAPPSQAAKLPLPQQRMPPAQAPRTSPNELAPHLLPGVERYAEIHKNLKELRKMVNDEGKRNNEFKKKAGDLRRRLRMTLGQLIAGKGVNKTPTENAIKILQESLKVVPSQGIDPSAYMLSTPEPQDGAINNGDQLPCLFIFLINHFSKAVIAQLVTEAAVNTEAADPIGVLVASIFSHPDLKWRGESLISILMAKMRKACPVLFGIRGSETTEEGRARLGWKKEEDGSWATDQMHNNRMTGLGAGYAAISLRDFSRARQKNPWPPYHYWQTMASIVSTPPEQASPTQYNVLKAMIEHFEGRFMGFYGDTAMAALRVALVDFPNQALDQKNAAVCSLKVLADQLEKNYGLVLRNGVHLGNVS